MTANTCKTIFLADLNTVKPCNFTNTHSKISNSYGKNTILDSYFKFGTVFYY